MTKQTSHTPGEWMIVDYPLITVGINGKGAICEVHQTPKLGGLELSHEIAMANARLIAAAPDLLAALERVLDVITGDQAAELGIYDALAKATKQG